MKTAMIVYHRHAYKLYGKWIGQFKQSVLDQTYKDFTIYELEYGGGTDRIFEGSVYQSKEFPTFVHGMNYLLDKVFEQGYDCCGNSNVDDHFALDRFEKQLPFIEQGYDLISSNFCLLNENTIVHHHYFDKLDIAEELAKNHNPVCHPSVIYSANFWKSNCYVPEQIPFEDMLLWERALASGSKIKIVSDCLLFHRLHNQSVCQSENR